MNLDLFSIMNTNSISQTNYYFETFKLLLTSWPLFSFIVILMFKKYICELVQEIINKIKLITKFKYNDWEAVIAETIDKNKVTENKLDVEPQYIELPAYIKFILAWIKFEANIRKKFPRNNSSLLQIIKPIVREIISEREYNVLKEINHYRNILLHENSTNIPEEENYRFIEFLEALTSKINNAFPGENNV